MKNRWRNQTPPQIRFGREMEAILKTLPKSGPLFPYLSTVRPGDRATEFKQRCTALGIEGVTLHSYRYAWAERAKIAGYPPAVRRCGLITPSGFVNCRRDYTAPFGLSMSYRPGCPRSPH